MKPQSQIRTLKVDDFPYLHQVINHWWGGRSVASMLPRLFFEHFASTSFAIGPETQPEAFLVGFISQSQPHIAYIHFVGVNPEQRQQGLARQLYEHFFVEVQAKHCHDVQCITSPVNQDSIRFHLRMGFDILPGDAEVNGIPVTRNHSGVAQDRVCFRKQFTTI